MAQQSTSLIRGLNFGSATSVIAGSVIGSGVFLVAGDIAQQLGSPWLALAVWLVAGIISIAGGLVFAELGAAYPQAGGQYVYLREAFGPLAGFLFGWTWILIVQPGSIAAVTIATTRFASRIVPLPEFQSQLAATGVIILFTLANLFGIKRAAKILDSFTGLKILVLIGIGLAGLILPRAAGTWTVTAPEFTWAGFGVALIAAFWAFDGWNNITFVAGEVENPRRNIPLALIIGITGVTLLYGAVNYSYYTFLPTKSVAGASFIAGDAAFAVAGRVGLNVMIIAVMLSALGCVNGLTLAGARISYAMAAGGTLPVALAYVHPRHHVPTTALWIQMIISVVLTWSGKYDQLFTYVVSGAFIFYGLTAVAVIALRIKNPGLDRPYRVPLYPALPVAYALFCFVFVLNAFREKPVESLIGLGIILAGIPVFYGRINSDFGPGFLK